MRSFGFKPKYNEDTGKIKSYALGHERIEVINRLIPFHRDYNVYGEIDREYYSSDMVDILYDLIKADMVVKE